MKDARGVDIKEGSIILFNGTIMTVTGVQENILVGGTYKTPQGQKIVPGKIAAKVELEVDTLRPVACFVLQKDEADNLRDKLSKGEGMQA